MTWSMISKWQRKEDEGSTEGNGCQSPGSVSGPSFVWRIVEIGLESRGGRMEMLFLIQRGENLQGE